MKLAVTLKRFAGITPMVTGLMLATMIEATTVQAAPATSPDSSPGASSGSSRESAAGDGTRIIGTEESPAVLNVVPWQERELGGNPATGNRQFRSVLDDALKPVDRAELHRETDYFNLLQKNQQNNVKNK